MPPTVGAQPLALLEQLGELITALDPQNLDPDKSEASATDDGAVFTTLVHRTEELAAISIDCSAHGTATVSGDLLGVPDEIYRVDGQSLEDWCADVLDVVTDALLERYTLIESRRNGRLLRTWITSIGGSSMMVSAHWTGILPTLGRRTDATTRRLDYACQGEPPSWLLRSAVFVIDRTGIVTVYPHQSHAEASLEAVDIAAGEYSRAYSEAGVAFRIQPHLGNGRLVPTGKVDPGALVTALHSWRFGPHHLADDPHAYAVRELGNR